MPVTMKTALAAKGAVKAALRSAGIAAACGITKTASGELAVKVNLPEAKKVPKLPSRMRGVRVVVEKVGRIRAMPVAWPARARSSTG